MLNDNARPKFGFSHMKVTVFLVFARNIWTKLTGNLNFPTVQALLANLDLLVNAYADAIDAALNRDKIKVADRNGKRDDLENFLKVIAGIIMGVSSDYDILLTSGFEVTAGRGPVEPVGQVQGLTHSYIPGVSGKMKFRWDRSSAKDAALFVVEQTTGDPSDQATAWGTAAFSKKCACEISGLTPGLTYSWRVYGIGALGPGGKSEAVSAMVI